MVADDSTHAETNAEFGRGARRPRGRMDPRAPPRVRGEDPPLEVHRFDEHTVVLRQSRDRSTRAGHVPLCGRADILAPELHAPNGVNGQWPHVGPSWRHAVGTNP